MSFMSLKKIAVLVLPLLVAAAGTACAEVPRGKVLGELMQVLDLPLKTGKTFGDVDETTPYGPALLSALSLGILYPADDFSPEIACTNAEALMFAFQAMGFRHEAETAAWTLPPEDKSLPAYISGYVALAKSVQPAAPRSVFSKPWDSITEAQLSEVLEWAGRCRASLVWDHEIRRPEGALRIHRENVGRPPQGWRVQLGIFDTEAQASAFARKKTSEACPLSVQEVDFSYGVFTPLVADRSQAHEWAVRLGNGFGAVILPESGDSSALFWTSFTPADPADAVIGMNRAVSSQALAKLSEIAAAHKALVAMNGGYFGGNGPIGALFAGGLPVTLPYYNRSMAAWNGRGQMHFGGGEFRMRLSVNGGPFVPVLLNSKVDYGSTAILTPALGASEARAGNNGFVARVHDGLVQEAVPALQFSRDMRPDEWLIVSRDPKFTLQKGDRVTLETQWRETPPIDVASAVQAGPLLYAPGHQFWDEMLSLSILTLRHPRTLLGWDGKRMVWIVADGRSSWHSRGLFLNEAEQLGRRLGLTALLNLDGGGSSEMWWDGHVVNAVSDGRERRMPYGLMVLKK